MEKQTQEPKKPNSHNTSKDKNSQQNKTPLVENQEKANQKKQDINEENKMKNNEMEIEISEGMEIERNNGRGDEGDEGNQQNWVSDSSGMQDENEQVQQQEIIMDQNFQYGQDQQGMEFDDDDEQYDSYEQEQQLQNKKFKLEIKKMNINSLSPLIKMVLENMSNYKPLTDLIKMPPSKKIKKQVCAKVITGIDTVIECFDCRMDPTCIICEDCFKNGNHEGHRYVLKKFAGGCCDCGDPEAWNEKGFCKNHSGLFKDFQVQPKVLEQFTNIMDGLFYLYFYLLLTNDKGSRSYTQKLLMFLNKLNNENTYYNKLTAHSLTRKLPAQYSLNEKLDNKTILQNILTSRISGNYFKKWFDLFINMFPYYPFKLDIIKHYIQNYGDVVDGAQGSANKALSISCQIMTSYKVVDQYSKEYNIGIGQRSQTPIKTKQLFEYCKMYFHDIYALTGLSEKASFNYWKMHINSKQSIRNLFQYYRILLKKVKSYEGENSKSEVQIIAKFINFSQTEQQLIQNFAKIIKIVSQQPKLVQKVIYVLWKEIEKVNKEYNPEALCIFRPIQRCLTLALFQYFDFSLQNIQQKKSKLIKDVLKINEDTFEIDSSMTLKKIFKTLFFYSKTQSSSGLAQTSYIYLYFYKINQRLLSMTDIVCLKMFLLLVNNPYPLTFESIMELNKDKIANEAQTNQVYLKQQQLYFASCLNMSKLVFTTFVPQIYLAYTINPQPLSQASQYKKEIKEIILNFFKQKQISGKYQVPQSDIKTQLLEGILPATCKIADKWVKTNCSINKNKKVFVLDNKLMQEQSSINRNINGLNFDDFMISLSSKDAFLDINKSIKFINGYNVRLFNILWNNISLESLQSTLHDLYNQSNKQLADSFNYSIVLPTILTVYILMKTHDNPNKSKNMAISSQILKVYLHRIPKNILTRLDIHLDSEQMSPQKQKIEQQEINLEKQQKKQKSNEIKLKKLESMKKKQQQFLQKKHMIQEQQEIHDKLNKNTNKQNQQTLQKFCNICKNELNQNSVYILNFTIRDHEKLLKLGKGLQCISINSCRHMFDYDCIKSMYKKNNYVDSITCSLCKFQGNVIFPASSNFSESLAEQIHDRFIQLLFVLKESADFYEEIIKSFYHYVLLCGLDFQRIANKKGELYHTLLTVLKKYIPSKQIDSLKQKLLNKKISKGFEKSLKTPSSERPNITSFFFNLLRNENIDVALDMQAQLRMNIQKQQSIVEPKKREYKQDEKQNYTELFFIVVSEILEFLANKNESSNQTKMEEENVQEENKQYTFVKDCLKTITGPSNIRNFERSSLYNTFNKKSTGIFKKMPQKYIQLSINKKCRECSSISQQAIMCLQCNWVGCQKQEKCLAKTHINEQHGEVGAIMIIQKSSAYYITSQKYIYAGELYEDEWENDILKTQDWNNFELNTNLLLEMERNILLDDIPTRHFKKKTA